MPMVSATSATNSANPGALAVASAGMARTDMVMIRPRMRKMKRRRFRPAQPQGFL